MKQRYTFLFFFSLLFSGLYAQPVCDSTGNLIIYSNYDGGVLNIDVDQNIPNLKIGIVTYEPVTVNITGAYVGNVTAVRYAGYVSTNNHHCANSPTTTTITGVPNSIDTVIFAPPAGYANQNGYSSIICNYSCSTTTNQGGCNTPDQVAYYFMSALGGTFRYHYTQYGCWSNTPYTVSAGGNCCATAPFPTGTGEHFTLSSADIFSSGDQVHVRLPLLTTANVKIELINLIGQTQWSSESLMTNGNETLIPTIDLSSGVYLLKLSSGSQSFTRKILVRH